MSDQKQNSAEIDLFYFFKPLAVGLKKLGGLLIFAFRKVITNFLAFSIIILLITLAGYSLRYIIKPAYETQGIFVSNTIPGKYCVLLLENLQKLKGEKNISLLSQKIKISEEAASDIQSMTMTTRRDTFLIDRRDSLITLLKVTLILKSVEHLDSIQWAFVNYLENNEYALKRKEARRKALLSLKETLNNKLESLDSLKKLVNSSIVPRSEGKGIILGEPIDPVSVYQAEVAYYREQLNIDQSLATIDNIEVIQPFLKSNQTNYPRYNRLMTMFFLASLIIAGLVVLIFGKRPK
jgi:hypothetical protein